jgi:hypothetical protein
MWAMQCVPPSRKTYPCQKNVYLPSLRMKLPDHVYVLGHSYTCYTYSCYAYHFYAFRLYFINVWHVYECNTMHVYHNTIITWATADSFFSLFPYPLQNPRSDTCDYVTHMSVNGSGVTSRKVRYGSRDFKVTRKKPAVKHIHINNHSRNYLKPFKLFINPLTSQLNPIFHLLTLLGAHHIFHISGLRVI